MSTCLRGSQRYPKRWHTGKYFVRRYYFHKLFKYMSYESSVSIRVIFVRQKLNYETKSTTFHMMWSFLFCFTGPCPRWATIYYRMTKRWLLLLGHENIGKAESLLWNRRTMNTPSVVGHPPSFMVRVAEKTKDNFDKMIKGGTRRLNITLLMNLLSRFPCWHWEIMPRPGLWCNHEADPRQGRRKADPPP